MKKNSKRIPPVTVTFECEGQQLILKLFDEKDNELRISITGKHPRNLNRQRSAHVYYASQFLDLLRKGE